MTTLDKYKTILYIAATAIASSAGERQIITAPIVVQAGDTLYIQAGSELLFANFTGITVKRGGGLSARGTKEQPIIFTSANDTGGAAAPFDWNGIEIDSGGTAELAHCRIAHATSGVTAADSGGVTLSQCVFSNNGQWHLSVAGVTQLVPDDMRPYDHAPRQAAAPPELIIPPIDVTPAPAPITPKPPKSPRRQLASWILGGAGAAAAVAGVAFLLQATNDAAVMDEVAYSQERDKSTIPATPPPEYNDGIPILQATRKDVSLEQGYYDALKKRRDTARTIGLSFLGFVVLDGVFLTILLY